MFKVCSTPRWSFHRRPARPGGGASWISRAIVKNDIVIEMQNSSSSVPVLSTEAQAIYKIIGLAKSLQEVPTEKGSERTRILEANAEYQLGYLRDNIAKGTGINNSELTSMLADDILGIRPMGDLGPTQSKLRAAKTILLAAKGKYAAYAQACFARVDEASKAAINFADAGLTADEFVAERSNLLNYRKAIAAHSKLTTAPSFVASATPAARKAADDALQAVLSDCGVVARICNLGVSSLPMSRFGVLRATATINSGDKLTQTKLASALTSFKQELMKAYRADNSFKIESALD